MNSFEIIKAGHVGSNIGKNVLESFKTDSRDFHVVTDLGGGFAINLNETLGDNWMVLDHHQIPDEEFLKGINLWNLVQA